MMSGRSMSMEVRRVRGWRNWCRKHWQAVVGILVGVVGAIPAVDWVRERLEGERNEVVSIDMSTTDECRRGNVQRLAKNRFRSWVKVGDNALGLAICDHDVTVSADKPDLPAEVARMYRGCLRFEEGARKLSLVLNSDVVCRNEKGGESPKFLCDGADPGAGIEPPEASVQTEVEGLKKCTVLFFEPGNRPGLKLGKPLEDSRSLKWGRVEWRLRGLTTRVIGNNAAHPGQINLRDNRAPAEALFGVTARPVFASV